MLFKICKLARIIILYERFLNLSLQTKPRKIEKVTRVIPLDFANKFTKVNVITCIKVVLQSKKYSLLAEIVHFQIKENKNTKFRSLIPIFIAVEETDLKKSEK